MPYKTTLQGEINSCKKTIAYWEDRIVSFKEEIAKGTEEDRPSWEFDIERAQYTIAKFKRKLKTLEKEGFPHV